MSLADIATDGLIVNLILAAGTLVLAIYAVKQTHATKIAADAAKTSADIMREGQRPQIALDTTNDDPSKTLANREEPRVVVALVNRGVLPAHGCIYESWIEVLPFPFKDFTEAAEYFKSQEPYSLYAGHAPVSLNIPFQRGLTDTQRHAIFNNLEFVCIRIRVTYRDAFAPSRFADFGIYIMKAGIGFLPKYNDSD
jgi:hypothetical protein